MKFKYIISVILGSMLLFSSCNDDFMQQDPREKTSEEASFLNESDMELYLNGLYRLYIIGHGDGGGGPTFGVFDMAGSPIMYGDRMSDNVVSAGSEPLPRLSDTYTVPINKTDKFWDWSRLKKVNYFLRNSKKAAGAIKEEVYNKYLAQAYFFKAWEYYEKVYYWGDVPWLEADLNIDSPELYSSRTPRKEVVDSIMMCLNFAEANLPEVKEANPGGEINLDMVKFLKARFCLYEGTMRKYHKLKDSDDANFYLEEAAKAAKYLIDSKRYSLYRGAGKDSYYTLFTHINSPAADGNKEDILAKVYDGAKVGHNQQRYWQMINHTRTNIGAPINVVNEYLCEDGQPLIKGGSDGKYTYNSLFKGYDGWWEELENRDPRLKQTIAKPGEQNNTIYDIGSGNTDINEVGITYPNITYPSAGANPLGDVGTTVTGYRFYKHFIKSVEQRNAQGQGTQTAHVFRYGELLLIYAEAKAELGTITDDDLNLTINDLRDRAGFDFAKYPQARLTLANVPDDPYMAEIYNKHVGYVPSKIIREIRRERRVELMIENMRREDLIRWKAGGLYTVPQRGMKITDDKLKLYSKTTSGAPYPEAIGHNYKVWVQEALLNSNVYRDADQFIIPYPISKRITDGTLKWNDRHYLQPIPSQEIVLNPNLAPQNPGWE